MRTSIAGILILAVSTELRAQEPSPRDWQVTVGAVAIVTPRYPGSDASRLLPLPLVQVTYRDRVFLGPSPHGREFGLGVYPVRTRRVTLAAVLGLADSRPASRADALAAMEDRDPLVTLGTSVSYRAGPVEGTVQVARGLNDGGGLLAAAYVAVLRRFGRVIATAGTGVTFADAKQMRRDFGISPPEAIRRQALIDAGDERLDPDDAGPYRPTAGLQLIGGSLSFTYLASQRWSLTGFGGVDRLSDEATASPLVRRRTQIAGGVALGFTL